MVQLEKFDIVLNNSEEAYFAGQEISGKERILPAGKHEVPFSYTLPKSLPSSFEGEFGHIRYTCKAICERPWDFDIVCRKAFTVIGIEDINADPKLNEPLNVSDSNHTVALCCRSAGSVSGEIAVAKIGYTPGEVIAISYSATNNSSRSRSICLRLVQNTTYKAKTFAGHEQVKSVTRVVQKIDKGEVSSHNSTEWLSEDIIIPSLAPRLGKCKIIYVTYAIELEIESTVTVKCPIVIGSIAQLSRLIAHNKTSGSRENGSFSGISNDASTGSTTNGATSNGHTNVTKKSSIMKESPPREEPNDSGVQVRITDESGQIVDDDAMSTEMNALLSARKRVRMPSSILSELYPSMPSPYYR
ncbi:hypothetical protein WR25_19321 isoform A [Diploscapter pachys]|uniref:Arrestin C-terminal-like domain-containing protein n=2 Tax=Diploscapter pachys TaxID=2018661 RepID=A0A2A2JUM9_9BILA|nr:hypothetical protein WR25_19321 isoform A [Diploscapter pachys]